MMNLFNTTVEVKETDGLSKAMIKGIVKGCTQLTIITCGVLSVVVFVSKYLIG